MVIGKKIFYRIVIIVLLLFVGACASTSPDVKPVAKSENPTDHVNRLENDLAAAYKNQLNVLAPTWFAKAESSLGKAKKGLEQGGKLSEVLGVVAEGQTQLQKAEEITKVTRITLADVIKSRDLARQAGAAKLGYDYTGAEQTFLSLTKAIEKGDLAYAEKRKAGLAETFRGLELRAIKDETLGEVRKLIKQAKNSKVDKIAPQSFEIAQNKLSEADAFITQNPYQKEMMHQKANDALFMSQRLLQIADQSEKFKNMKPEEMTLWMEKTLYEITAKLAATDMRNQPYEIQVKNILGSVDSLQKDRQFMFDKVKTLKSEIETKNSQIADLEGKTREQQVVKERLAAEKRFNQLFVEVQNLFSSDEAEVYKKGNSLIIRLIAIQFPVGKSVVMPDNYPLLSKIQQSIRTFGEPDVIIEGHTDSTGSNELNELLSQQRSESVRQYLLANKTLSYDRIVAVGYGSSKPLASNATEEGRAVNRRIDVIIKPQAQSGGN
ncbi:MAG: OmpA family protein [Desulfobacterales bacterium]|nr:OmpA family protein [Desulfobacterales bacterium]